RPWRHQPAEAATPCPALSTSARTARRIGSDKEGQASRTRRRSGSTTGGVGVPGGEAWPLCANGCANREWPSSEVLSVTAPSVGRGRVSKTGVGATRPRVRIPPSPLDGKGLTSNPLRGRTAANAELLRQLLHQPLDRVLLGVVHAGIVVYRHLH